MNKYWITKLEIMDNILILPLDKNIEICIIENAYEQKEYEEIWEEVLNLSKNSELGETREISGVALDSKTKIPLAKNKHSVFLDKIFINNRDKSSYFKHYKKFLPFLDKKEKSITWSPLFYTNTDSTVFAKYLHGSYYKSHCDTTNFTQLSWFCSDKKKFTGGDLTFEHFKFTIPFKTNTVILFPSFLKHLITPVEGKNGKLKRKHARYSFSTFYGYKE